jgi:hypothetical protein
MIAASPYAQPVAPSFRYSMSRRRTDSASSQASSASQRSTLRGAGRARLGSASSQQQLAYTSSTIRAYDERTHVTRVQAYRNGTYKHGTGIKATSRRELLDEATHKLDLAFAARRLYNEHGDELLTDMDCALLAPDSVVFVSLGEAFSNPVVKAATERRRIVAPTAALSASGMFPKRLTSRAPAKPVRVAGTGTGMFLKTASSLPLTMQETGSDTNRLRANVFQVSGLASLAASTSSRRL